MSTIETSMLGRLRAGSLAWRVTCLDIGKALLEQETDAHTRNACAKAIATACAHMPDAAYELVLHYGIRHDCGGDNFRFFKITRTA
jgi:hypothetical protein